VVRGQFVSQPWPHDMSLAETDVPRYVAAMHTWSCFARQPTVTPACAGPIIGDPDAVVPSVSSAGTNSPVFYAIVGVPTLFMEGIPALYAMRFVSALLCAAAFGWLVMQLHTLRRSRWAIAAAIVSVTPMVLYLAGSVNPNGVEAVSAVALFAMLVAVISTPNASRRVQWERAIGGVLLVTLLLGAKVFALLWLLLVVVGALAFLRKGTLSRLAHSPASWVLAGGSAVVSLLSLLWFIHPPHYEASNVQPIGAVDAFVSTVVRTLEFSHGYVGIFGWLDTPSPRFSDIAWGTFAVVLVIAGIVWGSGPARRVALGFGAILIVVPPVVQAALGPQVGFIWQGRYMLAIFMCLLVACGMALDSSFARSPFSMPARRAALLLLVLVLAVIALGHLMTFVRVLRRYVVGADGSLSLMVGNPLWQPPGGWIGLSFALAVWLAVVCIVAYRWFTAGSIESATRRRSASG
jgi:hypothetical protein